MLDSCTASRRCTWLRYKCAKLYMALKTVLELSVSRTVSLQSVSASRAVSSPWQLNLSTSYPLTQIRGIRGHPSAKNRKGLPVNKL